MSSYPLSYAEFKQALGEGRLLGLHCRGCDAYTLPPSAVCTECGGTRAEVEEMSPQGTIRTFTVIRVAPVGFTPPYVVALVEMDQGPWVVGNLTDVDATDVTMDLIGQRVSISGVTVTDPGLGDQAEGCTLIFTPAPQA